MTQKQTQQRNYWVWRAKGSLNLLRNVPEDIIAQSGLDPKLLSNIAHELELAVANCSYTYSTCNYCKQALTGRKHQSRNRNLRFTCDVCNRRPGTFTDARESRMKIPLHEARTTMRTKHPELFI